MRSMLKGGALGLLVMMSAQTALAQVGPSLLLKPWNEQAQAELNVDLLFQPQKSLKDNEDIDARVSQYESFGRARFSKDVDDRWRAAFGYEMNFLDLKFNNIPPGFGLDGHLADQRFYIGGKLGEYEGWTFHAGGGFGVSYQGTSEDIGDGSFVDAHGFYGLGDIVASHKIDDVSSIRVLLNYDGNRGIFPDVPLPSVAYSRKIDDTLNLTIGLPYSVVVWKPDAKWTVEVEYVLPVTINATVSYEIIEDFRLFGAFVNTFNSYKIDDDQGRRFFEQKRGELGLSWSPCWAFKLTVAGGYAFDQELSTGWDVRDTDTAAELGSAPYGRVAVALAF